MAGLVSTVVLMVASTGWYRPASAQPETTLPDVLGDVHFASSCNGEAQAELNRGVALYHSFWRGPALQSFDRVAELDPSCGIAYWGVAMAALINPFADPQPGALALGRGAVEQGQLVSAKTQRERDFIDAIAAYYAGSDDTPLLTRRRAYEQAMARVYVAYPDDIEAAVFYALALNTAHDLFDTTYARPLQGGGDPRTAVCGIPEPPRYRALPDP
jgi:hypothetical protein